MNVASSVTWKTMTWKGWTAWALGLTTILEIVLITNLNYTMKDPSVWKLVILMTIVFSPALAAMIFMSLEVEHHRSKWHAEMEKRSDEFRKLLQRTKSCYPPDIEARKHLLGLGYANVIAYIDELEYKLKAVPLQ